MEDTEENEVKHSVLISKRTKKKKKKNSSNSVQVAVRVRPLNYREKKKNEGTCIEMSDNTTIATDPETGTDHRFTYDFSYWSIVDGKHDFANQDTVYEDLGKAIVRQSFEGFNSCIFAYGQTGSGKSFSTFGSEKEPGIVPRLCHDLFETLKIRSQRPDSNVKTYRVEVSMIEIYNEKVRDLFHPDNPRNDVGLKVRENPRTGPYVMGLTMNIANNYKQLKTMLDEGSQLRTIGSTSMNDRSSRAHTIFQIIFTQIFQWTSDAKNIKGPKKVKKRNQRSSKINIIDLAGSERQGKAMTKGKRLKEGSMINLSLSMLGNVINKLAERSKKGGTNEVFVPYRNSTLTWLLKESLGGNSKTVMLATISPASYNFQETLSTLRYADRAKQIQNHAVVNEDSQSKLINDLKAEIKRLKDLVGSSTSSSSGSSKRRNNRGGGDEGDPGVIQMLVENQSIIQQLQKSEEERAEESQRLSENRKRMLREAGVSADYSRKEVSHMVNLNEDPSQNENLLYFFKPGEVTRIGAIKGVNDIVLSQPEVPPSPSKKGRKKEEEEEVEGEQEEEENVFYRIMGEHCLVNNDVKNNVVTIEPCDAQNCIVYVNNKRIDAKTPLRTGDRIILGRNKVFRFLNPNDEIDENDERSNKFSRMKMVNWDELKVSMEKDMRNDLEVRLREREAEIFQKVKKREIEEEKIKALKKEMEQQKLREEEDDSIEPVPNYKNVKLDLERDIEQFQDQLRDEQGEKRQLEDEKRFLEATLEELRNSLMKSKMELNFEEMEKERIRENYALEKKGIEGHTLQLQRTMNLLQGELGEVERETQRQQASHQEQVKKVEEFKSNVENLENRLKEEAKNKEVLNKQKEMLAIEKEEWEKKHNQTKFMLQQKTKEENQLFPILQQIIYAQNEKVRKNIDRLQQQLTQEYMEMESERDKYDLEIKEMNRSESEKQGEFVVKLIKKIDTLQEEITKLKKQYGGDRKVTPYGVDDDEEGSNKEEEEISEFKMKMSQLESEREILRMENMKLDTLSKEKLDVINQLRNYMK